MNLKISLLEPSSPIKGGRHGWHLQFTHSPFCLLNFFTDMPFEITMLGISQYKGQYSIRPVDGSISDRHPVMPFMNDPRFRDISERPGSYLDYIAVLSVEEALELAKSRFEKFPSFPTLRGDPAIEAAEGLGTFKKSLEGISLVVVHVAEC